MHEKLDPIQQSHHTFRKSFGHMDPDQKKNAVADAHTEALARNGTSFYDAVRSETDKEHRAELASALAVSEIVKQAGGRTLVVGGYVRDEAFRRMGKDVEPKDIDLEVYGIPFDELKKIVEKFGDINIVGEQFQVMKLGGLDIALPRRESKTGKGHKGFLVEGDPNMSFAEAAKRRDFTINAMGMDPLTGEIIDEYNGLQDLENKMLRAVDPKTFAEDPLRVLRAMQFAGRFGFKIDPETIALCQNIVLSELPKERIGDEWAKLLLKSEKPSIGLNAGKELGVIPKLHPELQAIVGLEQDPEWHPEGDVWTHTLMATDIAAEYVKEGGLEGKDALVIMLAELCHDLGKATTTTTKNGHIISHGHGEAGVEPARLFLRQLNVSSEVTAKVLPLVREHLFPSVSKDVTDAAVRRLANRLSPATIQELVLVADADASGRGAPRQVYLEGKQLLEHAGRLSVQQDKPEALVMGRGLLKLGIKPGKDLGDILKQLFEAQLDGKFATKEEGLEYLRKEKLIKDKA